MLHWRMYYYYTSLCYQNFGLPELTYTFSPLFNSLKNLLQFFKYFKSAAISFHNPVNLVSLIL